MRHAIARLFGVLLMLSVAFPLPGHATDVDGPDDCTRTPPPVDWGDAPEGVLAYPGDHMVTYRVEIAWGVADVHAPEVWAQGFQGAGIIVPMTS